MPFWKKVVSLWNIILLVTASILPLILMPSKALAATNFDLNTTTNYNLRFDGAAADDNFFNLVTADLDNNGKQDLLVGAYRTDNNSRVDSGSLYIIYDSLLDDYSGTGNNIDLATSTNYNLRFDGAVTTDYLAYNTLTTADIDNDGKQDILVGAYSASFNSRNNSGSFYVIYNTLIDDYSGTGNNIDLNTSANYNLRYDGVAVDDLFSIEALVTTDIDNDGKRDILVGARNADNNSRGTSGSVWVIYNTLIDDYSGTGNNIDLATSTNYNLRYDGAAANDALSWTMKTSDLDNDNKQDLLLGASGADNNSRDASGSLWIIYSTLIDDYSGTGNNIDLATSTNYNLRYDGAGASDNLTSINAATTADLDNDGKQDLSVGAIYTDNNSRSNSGSLYVIYNTLIDDYSGTGNNIDLATSTNYNLRYDGAGADDYLSSGGPTAADLDGDGKKDILVAATYTDNNSRSASGSLYVIYNTLIDDYSGTGNNIDLATSTNYNLRYDGAGASDTLGLRAIVAADLNTDDRLDLLIGSIGADNNSRSGSGSLWIIYNFPHTLSLTSISSPRITAPSNITGTLTATNSTTNISSIEWGVTNSYPGTWTACTADDSSFNSTTEAFTCSLGTVLEGGHDFYIRGYDTNSSYTVKGSYGRSNFIFDSSLPQGTFTTSNGDNINFSLILPKDKEYIEDNLPEFNFFKAKDNISGIERYQIILTNTQTKETDTNHKDNYVYIDNIDPNSPGGVETDGKAIENSTGINSGENSRTRDQVDKKTIYSGFSIKVKGKRDNDKLDKGIYKWKVRAIDFAGNKIDSEERTIYVKVSQSKVGQPLAEKVSTLAKSQLSSGQNNTNKTTINQLTTTVPGTNISPTPKPTPAPTLTSPPKNIGQPLPNQTPNPSSFLNIFNFLNSLRGLLPF